MLEFGAVEGQLLSGKYRVRERLGEGGMGVVYAAEHVLLDERVAIKFLTAENLTPEAVTRFEREARAAAKIKSEHVVRVLDVGHLPSGAPFMVMEFLDGEDLGAHLSRVGPLPHEVAIDFVLQACVAMADAHAAGIVHRDLKPGNLFCVRRTDGQSLIKVLDFGISKQQRAPSDASADSVTRTGAVLGSPLYMAPEQIRQARDVDARADIWSLGVVLFELLTGSVPFTGSAFGELAIKIATEPAPPLGNLRAGLPPRLEAAVSRCLEKERERRPIDVADLADSLLPFAAESSRNLVERIRRIVQGSASAERASRSLLPAASGPSGPQTAAAWVTTRDPRSNRLALFGGVTLIGVAVSALGWSLYRTQTRAHPPAPARTIPSAETHASAATAAPIAPDAPTVPVVEPSGPAELASVRALRVPATPTPRALQRARSAAAPARAAPVPPPAAAAVKQLSSQARPTGCDPPYSVDALGRKRFKSQCFNDTAP